MSDLAKPELEATQNAITVEPTGEGTLRYNFKNPSGAKVHVKIRVAASGLPDTVRFKPSEMAERFTVTKDSRGEQDKVAQFITEKFEERLILRLTGLADVDAVRVESEYRYLHEVTKNVPGDASAGSTVTAIPGEFTVGVSAFVHERSQLPAGYRVIQSPEVGKTLPPAEDGFHIYDTVGVEYLVGPEEKPIIRVLPVERRRALRVALTDLADLLAQLRTSEVTSLDLRQNLVSQVQSLVELSHNQQYKEVHEKLQQDVLSRTNGCASDSKTPDHDDLVRTCAAQNRVVPWIRKALELAGPPAGSRHAGANARARR